MGSSSECILNMLQVANGALFTLKHLNERSGSFGLPSRLTSMATSSSTTWRGLLEEAKLCWASGEVSLAMLLMKNLLKAVERVSIALQLSLCTLLWCCFSL